MLETGPSRRRLIILGAGGHGRVCADVARRAGYAERAFCDPALSREDDVLGVPVLREGEADLFAKWPADSDLFVAIGDNAKRLSIVAEAMDRGLPVASLLDPAATVSPSAMIDAGSIAMPGAVLNAEARVGRAAIVNTGAIVEHGAQVGQGAHVAPGACLTGDSSVGERAFVGARASILPGVRIGNDTVVGAGAVVTRDAGDHARLVGIPARTVHDVRLVSRGEAAS
ncbi:MAG: acetyltransferase [Alphaproteobacteria bacterium]|nr:acetyltransferase [Alphaproteobacteria bacterium]